MSDVYMTIEEAEEILMAVEVGVYEIDVPGARSKLAHARLLCAQQSDAADTKQLCTNHAWWQQNREFNYCPDCGEPLRR